MFMKFTTISELISYIREMRGKGRTTYFEKTPKEECQYNYGGTYAEFFLNVLTQDFPQYRTVYVQTAPKTAEYKMYSGDRLCLAVEVVSQNTKNNSLKDECYASRIPYLRFYHDHEGWWNTRSYVTARVRAELGV